MSALRWLAVVVIVLAACGDGPSSPEEVGRRYAAAIARQDASALRALFVDDDALAALVRCPDDRRDALRSNRGEATLWFELAKTGAKVTFDGWDPSSQRTVRTGDSIDGCVARRDLTLASGAVKLHVVEQRAGGIDTRDPRLELDVVRTGNGWRIWHADNGIIAY